MNTRITIMLIVGITVISNGSRLFAQKSITGFEAPESVVKFNDKIFVSNIGGTQPNPMALDSNGFISELSGDGKIIQRRFQKTILNGPKGLAIIGNVLYTADINRVVGFNITSGEQVFELTIPEALMLNDLCRVDDKSLVVSETITGKVFSLNIIKKTYVFLGRIAGANGVTYDVNTSKLYACGMGMNMNGTGKLYVKDITSKDTLFIQLPNSPTGVFDGLEMIDNDHLLVTDWISLASDKGRFVIYDLKNHTNKVYSIDAGPADVSYDKASHTFYLPQMMNNSLLIESLSNLKEE